MIGLVARDREARADRGAAIVGIGMEQIGVEQALDRARRFGRRREAGMDAVRAGAVLGKIILLVAIILVKPEGLMGRKEERRV